MIATCVKCGKEFLHASQGHLFYHRGGRTQSEAAAFRASSFSDVEFYWLCEDCATKYTLKLIADGKVRIVERPPEGENTQDEEQQSSPTDFCRNCSVLGMSND